MKEFYLIIIIFIITLYDDDDSLFLSVNVFRFLLLNVNERKKERKGEISHVYRNIFVTTKNKNYNLKYNFHYLK